MQILVLASKNKGKIKEITKILGDVYEIKSMEDYGYIEDIEETGTTFFENALIKAKAVATKLNMPVIADDSGLMVEALNNAPGIYSARYSGEHGNDSENRKLLLKNLDGVNNRNAKFASSVVLYYPNGKYIEGYGETYGKILQKEEGTNGFGYDSLFYSIDLNKSFGLATDEEKNKVSHRYRAIVNLKEKLNGN